MELYVAYMTFTKKMIGFNIKQSFQQIYQLITRPLYQICCCQYDEIPFYRTINHTFCFVSGEFKPMSFAEKVTFCQFQGSIIQAREFLINKCQLEVQLHIIVLPFNVYKCTRDQTRDLVI